MKTLTFTKQFAFGLGEDNFCFTGEFYSQFIVSNLDVRIKEVTPFFSYSVMDLDSPATQLVISGNGFFSLGSITEGRLLDSPVKYTAADLSTSSIYFPLNQRSVVDLRVFAGDTLNILLPFFVTGKGAVDNLFQLTVVAGVNILYEEVERKAFR